jgi:hypothetical protein
MKPYTEVHTGRTESKEVTIGALLGSAAAVCFLVWLSSFL